MNLQTNILECKGIGEKNGALFHKLDIYTVCDLLMYAPRNYEHFSEPVSLSKAALGEKNAVFGTIVSEPVLTRVKGYQIIRFLVQDEGTDGMVVRIFNMPYLKKTIHTGMSFIFYGKLSFVADHNQMDQPKLFKKDVYMSMMNHPLPIYPLTKGISNETIRKQIGKCLKEMTDIEDPLPLKYREKHSFPTLMDTFLFLHQPENMEQIYQAKKRMAYDEFLYFLLSTRKNEDKITLRTEKNCFIPCADTVRLMEELPYELTNSQKKAWEEIESDLYQGIVCNRLIQGDVGSGKTIIAVLALLSCVVNGKQGAFMAPTEVLANQHFSLIEEMIEKYHLPFKPALLTGSVTAKNKREIYAELKAGKINLVIGTHALLEDTVTFQNLGLVVTDEQHRFGVKQRNALSSKGEDVHTIVMSATPIPRSLAMILYGGLSISTIPEKPAQRLPIKNCVVGTQYRKTAYQFMQKEIEAGRQVYIICPMVEGGIMYDLENVTDYAEKLKSIFPEKIRIGILHGKMKGKLKNEIMDAFSAGKIDILVSTTVVEVGINVPNATVMMIENAQRFGLAALHQLRGRVGRGSAQSYCIFIDSSNTKNAQKRLAILGRTNDGFEIANEDLKLRGPGEMSGVLQSGDTGFFYADIYEDSDMLYLANADVREILKEDPQLQKKENGRLYLRWQEVAEHGFIQTI